MSTLLSHLDQLGTHVISAIINVDQEVEEDWPLFIQDNRGEDHEVILRPGEMIWYESARLIHGRQRPCEVTTMTMSLSISSRGGFGTGG